ncbi:sensor domain-containing protein [Frankia sp. AiPs1]|uniref:sensor histidine kinase n=1 Tax=Frankia sp. AiPs1 TaxID=573493 RepID=UPI002044B96F|nr:sensor histidine kinase [Frankia sp. AiPs1]MCM3921166.1 sensor domain-containing protein [Frankia sp. AiPs1]
MTMTTPPSPDPSREPGLPRQPADGPRDGEQRDDLPPGAGPRRWRVHREFAYTLVGLPVGIVGFVYAVVAISVGAGLAATVLGLPLLAAMVVGARRFGEANRRLAGRLLHAGVPAPRPFRPRRPGASGWIRAGLGDTVGWRALAYLLLKYPLAVASGVVSITLWSYALGAVTYPVWRPFLPLQHDSDGQGHRGASIGADYFFDTAPLVAAVTVTGLLLLLVARWTVHGLVHLDVLLIRGLLGPTRRSLTAQRVRDLERTRAAAVDDSAAALRRIERDLHDGAQVRLVAMAMNLGIAREHLAADGDAVDLDATRTLVDAAHREVKEALVELRNIARGIHPPILDRGLDAALASLVASSALPVRVSVDLPDRPSAAIETIAYFCVAELLVNAARHSHADEVHISIIGRARRVRLVVGDDGAGGARIDPGGGGGLAGLVERVRTVDGWLAVSSPPGGPTAVTVDLPLHA